MKMVHKSPKYKRKQTKQKVKKKKRKKNQLLQIAEQISMNILSLYCTFYSNTLNHFRTTNKRNSTQFKKSISPNCSLGNKTCYSRYCNSIWASCCNYCFVTFSMCIIRHISLHKWLCSTRKTSVNNILGGRNVFKI